MIEVLDSVYEWMRNILIFIIAVTVIFQLLENSSYRKYARFVAGMILILLIVKPLLKVSGKEQGFWYLLGSYDYLFETEDKSAELTGAEEYRNLVILEEYEKALAQQVNQLLNKKGLTLISMDAEFGSNLSEIDYGALKSLTVVVGYQKEAEAENVSEVTVEQIVIQIGEEKSSKNPPSDTSPFALSVKNLLADFYNLDAEHIHITIQEEGNG